MLGPIVRAARSLALPLLLLQLMLIVSACGLTEAPTHKTYTYSTVASLPKDRVTNPQEVAYTYQTGENVVLSWATQSGQDTLANKPQSVKIEAGLVGPFTSIESLKKAISFDGNNITGHVQATITPIQTNNWSDKAVDANLQLPSSMPAGYYMLVQRIQVGQGYQPPVPTGRIIKVIATPGS
ncbi:hypothetical protein [Ktedonobacter racemifer]|uniref:Uncharacterized protein n=1 Tax=Ktedonobacter racemifer DSM 44963 TaxID=485913 RepID=D6U4B7_KTERA|nr:hypothetical protein [Ktedonobacter racemifer]EFH81347.1 hypothetical protein Krac_2062 [Ktedonobacter racemifer DSM 44963]